MNNLYHIDKQSIFLFLTKLLLKALNFGNIVVLCNDNEVDLISDYLWKLNNYKTVLPHGTFNDPHAEMQLIYLTNKEENPNNANNLVIINVLDLTQKFLDNFSKISIITDNYKAFQNDDRFNGFCYWKLDNNQWISLK